MYAMKKNKIKNMFGRLVVSGEWMKLTIIFENFFL